MTREKRKKYIIVLLLLVFLLGLGYALVSNVSLKIGGTTTSKSQVLNVTFRETVEVSDTEKVKAETTGPSNENLTARLEVKDLTLNETVTATYTIRNEELDVEANVVTTEIINDNEKYFKVTTNLENAQLVPCENGELKVKVSVTLIKTPITKEDSTANIQIKFSATPVK